MRAPVHWAQTPRAAAARAALPASRCGWRISLSSRQQLWRRRLEQLIVAEVGRQLGQQRWPHAAAPRAAALTCVGGGNVGERRVELCSAGGAQPKLSTSAANAADTLPCDAGGPRRRGPRQRTVCKRRWARADASTPASLEHSSLRQLRRSQDGRGNRTAACSRVGRDAVGQHGPYDGSLARLCRARSDRDRS